MHENKETKLAIHLGGQDSQMYNKYIMRGGQGIGVNDKTLNMYTSGDNTVVILLSLGAYPIRLKVARTLRLVGELSATSSVVLLVGVNEFGCSNMVELNKKNQNETLLSF